MRFPSSFQSLALPALAAGLTLACADGTTTQPDPSWFAAAREPRSLYADDDGQLNCRDGYTLVFIGLNEPNPYDANQNAHICQYTGNSKPLHIVDGPRGCKSGYAAVQVSDGAWGKQYDLNGNNIICQLIP